QEDDASSNAGARVSSPLRVDVVDAVLTRQEDLLAETLAGFLASGSGDEQLQLWFGDKALEQASDDPQKLKHVLARDIAAIDQLIGAQLDTVLHDPDFKRLEASWRGVTYLLDEAGSDEKVKVRLFNATWQELARDFDRTIEFDQSTLFAKVYNDEYGMPGGVPYGLLLCDYAIRHRYPSGAGQATDDVGALSGLAQVAAASFAPCVISAAPELFGVSTFADLSHMQKLDAGF